MRKTISIGLLICVASVAGCEKSRVSVRQTQIDEPVKPMSLRDRIGATHVAGRYHLTDQDFLNEGADVLLGMGSRVIKVWFYAKRPGRNISYPFNSDWPDVKSLVELAEVSYYRDLFSKPFTTYMLSTNSIGRDDDYWREGMTEEQKQDEQRQFYELTKHLLITYRNTGKTFILKNWEGDWLIRDGFDPKIELTPTTIQGMIDWLSARQAGVNQARREVGQQGVWVYHAAEINRVVDSMQDGVINMVNSVLPNVHVDLISYSAWDATAERYSQPEIFGQALDFIADHANPSEAFGHKNVFLGEYGLPENDFTAEQVEISVTNATQVALEWGCPYVVYWQVYCNEIKDKSVTPPATKNEDMRGFWLIRVDGSKSWSYHYFHDLLKNEP